MDAVIAVILAILGYGQLGEVPEKYVYQTKDGIVLIDPSIATEYEQADYDQIKNELYDIQENAYGGGVIDFITPE